MAGEHEQVVLKIIPETLSPSLIQMNKDYPRCDLYSNNKPLHVLNRNDVEAEQPSVQAIFKTYYSITKNMEMALHLALNNHQIGHYEFPNYLQSWLMSQINQINQINPENLMIVCADSNYTISIDNNEKVKGLYKYILRMKNKSEELYVVSFSIKQDEKKQTVTYSDAVIEFKKPLSAIGLSADELNAALKDRTVTHPVLDVEKYHSEMSSFYDSLIQDKSNAIDVSGFAKENYCAITLRKIKAGTLLNTLDYLTSNLVVANFFKNGKLDIHQLRSQGRATQFLCLSQVFSQNPQQGVALYQALTKSPATLRRFDTVEPYDLLFSGFNFFAGTGNERNKAADADARLLLLAFQAQIVVETKGQSDPASTSSTSTTSLTETIVTKILADAFDPENLPQGVDTLLGAPKYHKNRIALDIIKATPPGLLEKLKQEHLRYKSHIEQITQTSSNSKIINGPAPTGENSVLLQDADDDNDQNLNDLRRRTTYGTGYTG